MHQVGIKMGLQKVLNKISSTAQKAVDTAGNAVVVTLAKAWIGIGMIRPANTNGDPMFEKPDWWKKKGANAFQQTKSQTPIVDRYDYNGLWSVQIADYFMPLSQSFRLRARKNLNTSHLVDGIDIIQQTRKEAKTIDCTLRITVNENQEALKIVDAEEKVVELSQFLAELYEADTVFEINNDMINNTFGVTHCIMSEYTFTPQAGRKIYTFEFSLTEVIYGENVLTFDLRGVESDQSTGRQITG